MRYSITILALIVAVTLLAGCVSLGLPDGTGTPSGVTGFNTSSIRLAASLLTVGSLDFGVKDATERAEIADGIDRGASALLAITAKGQVPTIDKVSALLPGLAQLYQEWVDTAKGDPVKVIAVVTALAQGAQDAARSYRVSPQ